MLPAPQSAATETPAASADAPAAVPAWVAAYLASLRSNFHKPDAACAAGVDLVTVLELRETDPAFVAQEHRIMTAYADLLESEALRRATALPTPGPDGKILRPIGSDRLLLRLMEHFLPGFAPAKKPASSPSRSASASAACPEQAQRVERAQSQSQPPSSAADSPSPAPDDLAALQKQIAQLDRENSNLKFHRKDLERRLATLEERYQQASRYKEQTFYWNQDLKAALVAANLPLPPKRTTFRFPDEPAASPEAPESGTAFQPVAESSVPRSEPASAEASPESPQGGAPASGWPCSASCGAQNDARQTESLPSSTPAPNCAPQDAEHRTLEARPPLAETSHPSSKKTEEGVPAHPTDAFLAREQAKLQAALAKLTAEHQRLLKAGWRPTHKPVLENREKFLQLQSCAIPIGEGLTFAEALAQSEPRTLRPP